MDGQISQKPGLARTLIITCVALLLAGCSSFAKTVTPDERKDTVEMYPMALADSLMNALLQQNEKTTGIFSIKQGWGPLGVNKSVTGGILTLGAKQYARGLGTHADSELRIALPGKARRFVAVAGMDNNVHTKQATAKMIFGVESGSTLLWKSAPLSVADGGVQVDLPLKELSEVTLTVQNDGHGIQYAHVDWADAYFEMEDGKTLWLDEIPSGFLQEKLPFSFEYGGRPSSEFLESWKRTVDKRDAADRTEYTIKWENPEKDLLVTCEAKRYKEHPATEWVLKFKNTGSKKSETLAKVSVADAIFETTGDAFLNYNRGSTSTKHDFEPLRARLDRNRLVLDTADGRTSQNFLPFWNLQFDTCGAVCAVGWSGSWKAEFSALSTEPTKGQKLVCSMRAGMQDFESYLNPGEEIRTPSFCAVFWAGPEAIKGNNAFRRFMRACVVPKWQGEEPMDILAGSTGSDIVPPTEANQKFLLDEFAKAGCSLFWIDAGWYKTGVEFLGLSWVSGRGNWFPDPGRLPNGLLPVADRAHKKGMRFLLWFDPEIAMKGTQVWEEHPEWCIKLDARQALYNFAIPEAVDYMIGIISKTVGECDIDVFRNDFNINPGKYWANLDQPGRRGMTEIRYVEGLYKLWDELLRRHPKLLIDNCASGGRRIDFETCKRSVPLWRSDVQCTPSNPLYMTDCQNQTYGLSMYLPFHAGGAKFDTLYGFRSGVTTYLLTGVLPETPIEKTKVPVEWMKKIFAETKRYREFFAADYYPLTPFSLDEDSWCAYQFNDPSKGGVAMFFRRKNAPYTEGDFDLKGLDPKATYELENLDTGEKRTGKGDEVSKITVRLGKVASAVILYRKLT